MTIEEALHLEIGAAHRQYVYLSDGPDDHWKTEAEFERDGGGDCEDWSAVCIIRACRRVLATVPVLPEPVGMIIGDVPDRHAWIGLGPDLSRVWFEPTPGYPCVSGAPWTFSRTPLYARYFEPGRGFVAPVVYHP